MFMNIPEIKSAAKHIQKTCKCLQCNQEYKLKDINIVATTNSEALFELVCEKCQSSSIVTVLLSPESDTRVEIKKSHHPSEISQDDVLDIKNFLTTFDGNFKKIFTKKK